MARRKQQTRRALSVLLALSILAVFIPLALATTEAQLHENPHDNVLCTVQADGSSSCYPKVFEATNEFKPVLEGQQIPQGLHVRLNLQTGVKEAKLYVEGEEEHLPLAVPSAAQQQDLTVVEDPPTDEPEDSSPPNMHGKTDPYVKPNPRLTLAEQAAFGTIVDSIHNATVEELIETLEFLEEVVHHVDFGQQFAKTPAAIPTFIGLLDHEDVGVRSQALLVLGNALSNNPPVQAALQKAHLLPILLTHINHHIQQHPNAPTTTPPTTYITRLIFTLGALTRSHPPSLTEFHSYHGLHTLHLLYNTLELPSPPPINPQTGEPLNIHAPRIENLRSRVLRLASDLLNPSMENAEAEVVKPEESTSLEWCKAFQVAYLNHGLELGIRRDALEGVRSLLELWGEEGCRPVVHHVEGMMSGAKRGRFDVEGVRRVLGELDKVLESE
ncbi:hypothetical protein HDV00_001952 [Rhizophlyctis rosea]|nr:hypothetical protein HDV00_001952 [Rhizophlyctis rosea]